MKTREVLSGAAFTALGASSTIVSQVAPGLFPHHRMQLFWIGLVAAAFGIALLLIAILRKQPAAQVAPIVTSVQPAQPLPASVTIRKAGKVTMSGNYSPGHRLYEGDETGDFHADGNQSA